MNIAEILDVAKGALLRGEDIGRLLFFEFASNDLAIMPIDDDVPYGTPAQRMVALTFAGRKVALSTPRDKVVCVCLLQRGGITKIVPGQRLPVSGSDPRRREVIKATMLDAEQHRYVMRCPEIIRNARGKVTALVQDLRPVELLRDACLDAALFGYQNAGLGDEQFTDLLRTQCATVHEFGEAWAIAEMT